MAEPFDTIGASFADVIDRLAKGEITEAQAATALSPLLAATNDGEFAARVEEIVGVIGRVTGILFVEVPEGQDRPSNLIGAPEAYAWDRGRKTFWGPKDKVTGWPEGDVMTEGRSALQVLIDGGVLPPGSTVEDFGIWLADSQIAAVTPHVEAAAASAQAAEQAATAAGQDATATAADRLQTGEDRGVTTLAATAAVEAAASTAADREQTGEDRTAAEQAATAAGQDATATAADRVQTGEDRGAAEAARDQAKIYRDEAGEIAGGDFLTQTAADAIYRKLADLLNISDVTGLAAALASKATPADVAAAINALVGAAPGTLDTIYELAAWAEGSEDALAAVMLLLAGKASQADFDTLVATVAAISVPTFASVAEVWTGAVTTKIIPPKVLNDAMIPTALAIAGGVVSPDCHAGINFDIASINANITIANLANKAGKGGRSGSITGKNDATAGRTVSLGTDWKKIGTTAFPTAANAMWKIVYNIDANGVNYSVMVLAA